MINRIIDFSLNNRFLVIVLWLLPKLNTPVGTRALGTVAICRPDPDFRVKGVGSRRDHPGACLFHLCLTRAQDRTSGNGLVQRLL